MVHVVRVVAGNVQEVFLKGNVAYLAGNIDGALKLYQTIDPKGPAVWYNLGNCYYRIGNYPEAIVAWRRAQKDAS
jgi:tetratricopeptide (TPR) repeat protein